MAVWPNINKNIGFYNASCPLLSEEGIPFILYFPARRSSLSSLEGGVLFLNFINETFPDKFVHARNDSRLPSWSIHHTPTSRVYTWVVWCMERVRHAWVGSGGGVNVLSCPSALQARMLEMCTVFNSIINLSNKKIKMENLNGKTLIKSFKTENEK